MTKDEWNALAQPVLTPERLVEYLKQTGRNVSTNSKLPFLCPFHEDHKPSCCINTKARHKVKCFACDKSGDLLDVIGADQNLNDKMAQLRFAYSFFGLAFPENGKTPTSAEPLSRDKVFSSIGETEVSSKTDSQQKMRKKCLETIQKGADNINPEDNYFVRRGIRSDLVNKFRLGQLKHHYVGKDDQGRPVYWDCVTIPTDDGSVVVRNLNGKDEERYRKFGQVNLFNSAVLDEGGTIFVTEGEIDAMSVMSAGFKAVGLGSTSNYGKLLERIEHRGFSGKLVLGLDADNAGREASNLLSEGLTKLGVPHAVMTSWMGVKDANEALRADASAFADFLSDQMDTAIQHGDEARDGYTKKRGVISFMAEFTNKNIFAAKKKPVSCGFKGLDSVFYGGLRSGLYVIGAMTSLGKTAFVMQMADHIAAQGQDVLVFALEMSREHLIGRSISRMSYEYALGSRRASACSDASSLGHLLYEPMTARQQDCVGHAIDRYSREVAPHLFIEEAVGNVGANDVGELARLHRNIFGKAPVIIVDYLQILAPHDARATDKQIIDRAVVDLKRISRDLDVPVIAVSSFSRSASRQAATLESNKESGAIEYTADVCIGLQFKGMDSGEVNVEEAKRMDERLVEAKVLKNRIGRTPVINFKFRPEFNYYEENSSFNGH